MVLKSRLKAGLNRSLVSSYSHRSSLGTLSGMGALVLLNGFLPAPRSEGIDSRFLPELLLSSFAFLFASALSCFCSSFSLAASSLALAAASAFSFFSRAFFSLCTNVGIYPGRKVTVIGIEHLYSGW